ncbi:hypothetical protein [Streptomyces sp. NPDC050546]|uniref:hypothetical protein n=1 Tax=Streptomyces sp. NPDC050546 TaxID=3365628 RepID=UPI00378BC06C
MSSLTPQDRADGRPGEASVAGPADDRRGQAVELLVQLGEAAQGFSSVIGRKESCEVAGTVLDV